MRPLPGTLVCVSSTPRPQAPPDLRVGGYELLARIGEGGMGVVHLARRPGGERVALKVLRPHIIGDDESRARLAREVGSLQRIRSPRIAEIVDADPWGPVPFVATRYVPGLSLHDHVHEEGPLEGSDLTWFAACLAEALDAVHGCGVLHRDVKPSNVLMEGRSPVLIDFGLARVADDPKLTHTGWLLGTPGYLAPEILYGEDATTASDVHSWAATVAFAGTGQPPFGRGPSLAIMDRVRRGEHRLDGLPAGVAPLVAAALDPTPARRPTLSQIRAALAAPAPTVVRPVVPRLPEPDPYTLPLALAAFAAADATTGAVPVAPTLVEREAVPVWSEPGETPASVRDPWSVRLRQATLVGAVLAASAASVTAYPYIATVGLGLVVWLLRSGSLAGSAAGDRRRLRGLKWYDGPQVLASAPWHLVRALPTTLLLGIWAGLLAVAGGLLAYAFALPLVGKLFAAGLLYAAGLWWGPGGSRVRRPVQRVVRPLAARPVGWALATVLVAALATGATALATDRGVNWSPARQGPLANR